MSRHVSGTSMRPVFWVEEPASAVALWQESPGFSEQQKAQGERDHGAEWGQPAYVCVCAYICVHVPVVARD